MNRRSRVVRWLVLPVLALFFVAGWPVARAQEVTPASEARLGLPALTITITDDGFDLPANLTAGRYFVTTRNKRTQDSHFFLMRIPDAVTDKQLENDFSNPDPDYTPPWFFDATFVGNPDHAAPGAQVQGFVDLPAGRYLAIDPLGSAVQRFTVETATGSTSAAEPKADVTVEMVEMGFSGLDRPLAAGEHVWKVSNGGALPHELAILPVPEGATVDGVLEMLRGMEDPADFHPVGGQGVTSPGHTAWELIDLSPGTYAALCMFPDDTGVPHAMSGMVRVFTVR